MKKIFYQVILIGWVFLYPPRVFASGELWQTVIDYWKPKVQSTYVQTRDYWKPKIEKTVKKSVLSFDEFFREKIHPNVRHLYKSYYELCGKEIGEFTLNVVLEISRHVNKQKSETYNYWSSKYPETFSDMERIPTPIKKGYEKFIFGIWKLQNVSEKAVERMPDSFKGASEFAVLVINSIKNQNDHPENTRLTRLLNRLRPYATDPEMRSCYKVSIIDLGFNNAFNTGCNIFVTLEMAKNLSDEELLAVLAHEISHGDQGHSVESIMHLLSSGASHVVQLTMDELLWLNTGEKSYRLNSVLKEGNLPMILQAFGEKAPKQEIEADYHGACLLKSAGLPESWMRMTLLKLHDVDPKDYEKILKESHRGTIGEGNVRKYPSLAQRLKSAKCKTN